MRVILFTDSLGSGGAQRQLVGLAVLLKQKGFDVSVVLYYDFPFYADFLRNHGVHFEVLYTSRNPFNRISVFRKYFIRERPNWVIAYQETPSLVACVCKLLGCKFNLIVSERNTTQHIGVNERIRFFLYHWADVIVPNSYTQEHVLTELYPWMKKKITTITNYLDLNLFTPQQHCRRKVPEILVAATIFQSKNVIGLIEAANILRIRGVKFHISWYGLVGQENSYSKKCLNMIATYGLGDFFEILAKTKKIHLKYMEADYFCLPSYYEGTPNVICEAIATGLPVMCSDVCDNSIYVKDNMNGVLFNPNDPTDMADKIEKLLGQDEKQYEAYSICSRQIAEKHLSEEIFVNKYLSILCE